MNLNKAILIVFILICIVIIALYKYLRRSTIYGEAHRLRYYTERRIDGEDDES